MSRKIKSNVAVALSGTAFMLICEGGTYFLALTGDWLAMPEVALVGKPH